MVCKRRGGGCPFQCLSLQHVMHWVCVWLMGTVVFQLRPGSFSRRGALFIQWVKFDPQYSCHKHTMPHTSLTLETTQPCSFLHR